MAYLKSGTRDPKLLVEPQDPRPKTHLIGGTRDLRLRNLKVRHKTRDPTHSWEPGPETRELKVETRDTRPGTLKVYFQNILSVLSKAWRL